MDQKHLWFPTKKTRLPGQELDGLEPLGNTALVSMFIFIILLYLTAQVAGFLLAYQKWGGDVTMQDLTVHVLLGILLIPYTLIALYRRGLLKSEANTTIAVMILLAVAALVVILVWDSLLFYLNDFLNLGGTGAITGSEIPTAGTETPAAGTETPSDGTDMANAGADAMVGTEIPWGLRIGIYGVLVPVTEELVFRGAFFGGLRTRFGFLLAAAMSSILFALMHGSLIAMASALVGGLVFSFLYHKTGLLAVPISVHIANNLIALYAT